MEGDATDSARRRRQSLHFPPSDYSLCPSPLPLSTPLFGRLVRVGRRQFLVYNDVLADPKPLHDDLQLPTSERPPPSPRPGSNTEYVNIPPLSWRMRRWMYIAEVFWDCGEVFAFPFCLSFPSHTLYPVQTPYCPTLCCLIPFRFLSRRL